MMAGLIVLTLSAAAPSADALEPAERFLEELKARGYYDLAIAYLDRLEKSALADPEFLAATDYHQGEVLTQAALQQRTLSRKQTDLDRAQQEFEKFTREHADHPFALMAKARLGEIMMERARLLVVQADQANAARDRPDNALLGEARQLFDKASATFRDNQGQVRARLEKLPAKLSADRDQTLIKERDALRTEYVQAQFVGALVEYEQALTYPAQSAERKRLLQKAEESFTTVAEKYRRRVAGLSAVLFQGRCRQQLDDPRTALSYYEDLLTLPDGEPVLRPLKTKALRGAMECWLHAEIHEYETARQRGEAWLQQQRPTERTDEDWLMVKMLLAETYQQIAEGMSGRDKAERTREARRLAIDVAKYRSDAQPRAQALLAQLGHVTKTVAQNVSVDSFDDAMAAARDALAQRQVAAQTAALLQERLPRVDDEAGRQEIQQRLDESEAQREQAEASALERLGQAQNLVTDETPIEQINQARYYLCTLYYYRQDYHSAAVLADFLSSRFPATEEGRRAAAVSLASLIRLYGDGQATWAPALHQRMTDTALRIARQWKGQPEADDALATLVTLAVQTGDAATAVGYLDQMAEDSPKRAAAELAAGQALWAAATRGGPENGAADAAEPRQREAIQLLANGLQRSTNQAPTAVTLSASLIVAQHLLSTGQAPQAIETLENAAWGPKTLADQNHPLLAKSPELKQRTYLLSIMAYLSAISQGASAESMIEKALATLDQIKNATGEAGDNQRHLSATYVLLARNLQQQIQEAPARQRDALVRAFGQMLEQAARTTRELSVLSWVADSYVSLGKAVREANPQDPAAARPHFEHAVSTYKELLKRSDAGEFTMTQQERLLLDTRLAIALQEQGEYAEATDRLATILERQPNQVYVQMEAARMFQRWGASGRHQAYLQAIMGDRPDPKTGRHLIWGYGRLAQLVASKPDLRGLFHEARLGVAECRFQYALQLQADARTETLRQAEQDVVMTARLYPDLGGEETRQKYEHLLQQIQRAQGKNPTGLSS